MGKTRTYYLVFAAKLLNPAGKTEIELYEPLRCEDPKLVWTETVDSLEKAREIISELRGDTRYVALALYEWTGEGPLKHGSHALLQCTEEAKIRVISFEERPYRQERYKAYSNRIHEVEVQDWRDGQVNIDVIKLGGGTLPKWSPLKIQD